MFNKGAKFQTLPTRSPAPGVAVPANDNRRGARRLFTRRARAPRLVCRWELDGAGRPTCRWELETTDEPSPGVHNTRRRAQAVHKTVFQLSYQDWGLEAGLHDAGFAEACAAA